jgi:hypothetical protein
MADKETVERLEWCAADEEHQISSRSVNLDERFQTFGYLKDMILINNNNGPKITLEI